jgi:hypothetical protein
LTTNVRHIQVESFEFDWSKIEPNCWNYYDWFTEFQSVQDRRLSRRIKSKHRISQLLNHLLMTNAKFAIGTWNEIKVNEFIWVQIGKDGRLKRFGRMIWQ